MNKADSDQIELAAQQPDQENDRLAEPVDAEQPPRLPFPVVGIGGSAGGLEAFTDFFKAMPHDSGMAFVLVQHLPPDRESMIAEILQKHTKMPVAQVKSGMKIEPDHVYVIRPGHTLTIKNGVLQLGENVVRPLHGRPVDDFFRSLAEEQRERAICIVMSGMGSNGAAAQAVKAVGGMCIAQDPETAQFPSMPRHLIEAGYADHVLQTADMPNVLIGYAQHPYTTARENGDEVLRREQQQIREVLAILRTRTRHDYSGYKKPTILRRVQRRMGINRVTKLGEYTKILRQSPNEVTSLADDLLIHVTGFFRDQQAWDALRERVIVPLVASRDPESPVRCWVTACSSGEEAYSLGILLVEECERVNKPLDIKIFATDTAQRTLGNARNGIYPGGIEAEISAARLERFFRKEDAVYSVRQDLRERVVFAPQNVLQDPPFSRLDIATCRNLLIYLEPDIQQRVLSMLHFGLRDGGTLFLGSSETIAGTGSMFEPIDKKARIFKRIGPTRHGAVDFPLPRGILERHEAGRLSEARAISKPSVAQQTARTLLDLHVPAAVTVDREHRVIYYHGNTGAYLNQPTGEPTREILQLTNENVRGAVRSALQQSIAKNSTQTVQDGWIETPQGRRRIIVTVSPLEQKGEPDFFVVSFQEREESPPPQTSPQSTDKAETEAELNRVRDELQSTIEELQTTNEEHKASAEEIMSINEELQSSNEELETSKEEMQSLNEELTTVNAQLQAKIEEHQMATNDMSSLLASTDIAVIFLDSHFNIRRYTPAAKNLLELIQTDVGRPLDDLAKKFHDPDLLADSQLVLEKLVPISKEVLSNSGRWYSRRILPYRTADNHIGGVVITFVDITEIKSAQGRVRESEERLAAEVRTLSSLHELTRRLLLRTHDLETALNQILEAAIGINEADKGNIQFLNPETKELSIVAHRGFAPGAFEKFANVITGPSSVGARVLATQQRVVIDDINKYSDYQQLLKVAEQVGIRGVIATPLKSGKGEVIGVLSTYFREPQHRTEQELRAMDLFVQQATEFILRVRSERRVDELVQNEQSARDAVDSANRVREDFIATLSHELRTPLSAILLWAKALRDKVVTVTQSREGLDAIITSAQVQARLIDDMLDTSRIAAGKMRLDLAPTDLSEVVRSAVEAISVSATARNITIDINLQSGSGDVLADGDRLRQVVWNLLSNAVKFTPEDGRVTISTTRRGSTVELRVSDTGAGIEPDFLPLIFDRFRQFDASKTRKAGGLGLGLSISKQLVELHGGTIQAESEGPGKGATFIVQLPLPQMAPAGSAAGAKFAAHTKMTNNTLAGLDILLVEDEPGTRDAVVFVLDQAGAKVKAVGTAELALKAFRSSPPDVFIGDIGLPDIDGFELIKKIRALEAKKKVKKPVHAIALTAYARDQDRHQAAAAGYQMHIAKPVEEEKLIAAVARLAKRH